MPESEYLIKRREILLGIRPADEKKKPEPIANKSDKMKAEMKKYIPAMKAFLALPENENCKIKMKGCQGKAVCVHHSGGRIGHKLHDQADWIPSCAKCNLTVEEQDLKARELGHKKSKFKV
jgi:hypothetical protein